MKEPQKKGKKKGSIITRDRKRQTPEGTVTVPAAGGGLHENTFLDTETQIQQALVTSRARAGAKKITGNGGTPELPVQHQQSRRGGTRATT